jgi:hypothetical protein
MDSKTDRGTIDAPRTHSTRRVAPRTWASVLAEQTRLETKAQSSRTRPAWEERLWMSQLRPIRLRNAQESPPTSVITRDP